MKTGTQQTQHRSSAAAPFRSAIHPRLSDTSLTRRRRQRTGSEQRIDPGDFRTTLGHAPTSVVVVTAGASEGLVGVAIGSFVSISLDPPLVGFFADKSSSSLPKISRNGNFCANVLGADRAELGRAFSRRTQDRFEGVEWSSGDFGNPILADALAWIECDIDEELVLGDHVLVVGRVRSMRLNPGLDDPAGLVFYRGAFADLDRHAGDTPVGTR